ncbi:uncharacterized protein LOC125943168 [Dermacentor silvarum]|uniref:uncharacterized protein LOC125943168 n=1 Tax=Dermacentor silvarum TaxID=543639 RepID=UPI00210151AF|nr:uncharacterized protein LOC125943168 [Dermacentor silvarum]
MTKHESTTPSGQAHHHQPTFSFTEGKQPFSVAAEDSKWPGFAADLHKWFRTEDSATAKYPISVQAETSNEDSSGIEFPPWPSHSETEPEKAFHPVDLPVAAPNREGAKKIFAVPSLLQELEGPFVFDPTEKDDGVESTQECIHTDGVSGTDQGTVVASLNNIPDLAGPQISGLAIAAGTDGAGKTKVQKRRLSFSDEVTASDDAASREKHKLLVGYSDVGSRADASPSENAARSSRKQATYIYLAGATIPEEEYSLDKHELSAALESDTSAKADEEELMLPYNARQSAPDGELNNEEHRTGSASQYGELIASTFTQSAPNDVTTATNATWSAENRDDDLQRPVYVETGFEDARRQVNKSWLSLRTGSADYSNEQVENTRGGETAFGDRRANATEVGDNTWESSTREFESSVPTGAATSDPAGAGGVPSTERKASLSSVSVGYTQEPQPNDGNVSSYSGDASDDLESLKMRLFGTRSRSQGPGDIADDEIRKSEATSTLSASHIVATDAPFPWEHTRSVDSETGYAPAIILRDDAYQMSLPGSAVAEGVADIANKYEVPAAGKETTKSESALSPTFGDVLNAEEGATRHGEEQSDSDITARAAPIQLEPSQRGGSESPTNDDGEGRIEHLLKTAGVDRKDDAHDISHEVPDADDESSKLASHCEELRFENFRTVVEHMADLSARSETNIVYESFVPAIGKVRDMLGSVYYDTAFTVRVVDDYDLPSIMYDRWNEDAASVAPTIKTFWTYSPHSVLMSVDENGTHCGIISAIVFEDEQAFCAANSVKCDFLANGVKRQLWDALLSVQRGKNLFTVVPAEQVSAYYRHLGFYTSARGLILHGKLASDTDLAPLGQVPLPDGVEIAKFKKQMYASLLSFDKSTLGFGRKRFWRMTLREGPISFRVALRGGSKGQVCGYAGLQNDVSGVPVVRWLVAADEHVAVRLLHNLLDRVAHSSVSAAPGWRCTRAATRQPRSFGTWTPAASSRGCSSSTDGSLSSSTGTLQCSPTYEPHPRQFPSFFFSFSLMLRMRGEIFILFVIRYWQ